MSENESRIADDREREVRDLIFQRIERQRSGFNSFVDLIRQAATMIDTMDEILRLRKRMETEINFQSRIIAGLIETHGALKINGVVWDKQATAGPEVFHPYSYSLDDEQNVVINR